ncbi:GMC family oxidoreductase [Mycobacterium sp. C31M]
MKESGRYDTIIVGAGSTGCALGARLAEDPSRSVLIVEAGKRFGGIENYPDDMKFARSTAAAMPGHPNAWSMMGELIPGTSFPVSRGKVLGGSSATNGAIFLRSNPDDYDGWARLGNSEWSYEKVLPYLIKQETDRDFGATAIHGGTGPIPVNRWGKNDLAPVSEAFAEACVGAGHAWDDDMNSPDSTGVGLLPFNAVDGIRQNAAVCYLEPIAGRSNLTIMDEALVHRVVFDGYRAVGVEVSRPGEGLIRLSADEVVLCAGALKSPQLLMLSGIGPSNVLKPLGIDVVHESPYVGQNFIDHPFANLKYRTDKYIPNAGKRPFSEVALNFDPDSSGTAELRIYAQLYTHMNMLFGIFHGQGMSDRLRATGNAVAHLGSTLRSLRGTSLKALKNEVSERGDLNIGPSLGTVDSRGQLSISSTDPAASPVIEFRYMSEPKDLERMRFGVRTAVELMNRPEFQRLKPEVTTAPSRDELRNDAELNKWILAHLSTSFHASGTCKMGPHSDETAVVDQYGSVRGVDGLRVIDISILPTIPRRPTNATAVMLGERASAFMQATSQSAH